MDIRIDLTDVDTPAQARQRLSEVLPLPENKAWNLDALYDCLTDLTEETTVILFHSQALAETLGTAYTRFCRVLTDAAAENPRLHIQI